MSENRPDPLSERRPKEERQEAARPPGESAPGQEGLSKIERDWLTPAAPGESVLDEVTSGLAPAPDLDKLRRLININRRISRYLDLSELLEHILDAVLEISSLERAFIMLAEASGQLTFRAGRDHNLSTISSQEARGSRTLLQRAYQTGQPVWVDDPRNTAPGSDLGDTIHALELETVICLPLEGSEGPIGVLYLDTQKSGHLAHREDLPLLMAFASQASIAIENAKLHEQVRHQSELLENENKVLRQEVGQSVTFENIIGQSPPMKRLFSAMERVKDLTIQVLITGESGTGKELIAKALHYQGARRDHPFLATNCGTQLNDDLWFSRLFGHKRGSFTGAIADRAGLFELADGGTLFLDEVAELSPTLQAGLLRALEDGIITRLGEDDHPRKVDVRLISATNQDLDKLVERGLFREDLLFRLRVVSLHVPPLRERGEDIRLLVENFLDEFSKQHGFSRTRLTPEAYSLVYSHAWPGNVRELKNAIERAVVLSDPGVPIGPEQFPELLESGGRSAKRFEGRDLREKMESAERMILSEELELSDWNISRCARRLSCTRQHLHNRIRKLGLRRPEKA